MPKQNTFYFAHDFDPKSDPKMAALIGEHGAAGYGIYWAVVEMLHATPEHALEVADYVYLGIAKQIATPVEKVKAVIDYAIKPCSLFKVENNVLTCERVKRNIAKRQAIIEQKKAAGKRAQEKRRQLLQEQEGQTSESATAQRKKKFVPPSLDEFVKYFTAHGFRIDVAERAWKGYDAANWCDTQGKKIISWKQKCQNVWFVEENKVPTAQPRKLSQ